MSNSYVNKAKIELVTKVTQPNRALSATLVETFLCASFHTFSCYLRFFSFWNEHHC